MMSNDDEELVIPEESLLMMIHVNQFHRITNLTNDPEA
jgi:hypothetical protein